MHQEAGCTEAHPVAVHIPVAHAQEAVHILPSSPDATGVRCEKEKKDEN